MEEYPFKDECYKIIGCYMDVHNELGCGFLEAVYQEALSMVLLEKKIPFGKEKVLDIEFRNRILDKKTSLVTDYTITNTSWRVLKLILGNTGLSNKWWGVNK